MAMATVQITAGRRAVVTGGLGFIGAHVAQRLVAEGYRVLIIDSANSTPPATPPAVAAEVVVSDVADPTAADAVERFRPDLVVHAAAQTRVPASLADPLGDAMTNVLGTLSMLEAAVRARAHALVYLSSAAIYGEAVTIPIGEDHPTQPLSPYGLSKLAATRYVEHYQASGRLPTATLVPANVYGPGQLSDAGSGAVVAAFARAAARGEPLQIAGSGEQTRDLVFVDDVVDAVWRVWCWLAAGGADAAREAAAAPDSAIARPSRPGAEATLNISSGREISINALADAVEQASGRPLARVRLPARSGDISRSCLAPARAERVLGWRAGTGLAHGLQRTLAWWDAQPTP